MKIRWGSIVAVVLIVVVLTGCSSARNKGAATQSTTQESKIEKKILAEQEDGQDKNEKAARLADKYQKLQFSSYSSEYSLDALSRSPKNHIDSKIYSLAKIIQIINDPTNNHIYYLGYVTPEKNVHKTIVLKIPKDEVMFKILENDEVRFFARYQNQYEYNNTQGVQKSAPLFEVDAYQNVTAEQEVTSNNKD